ncbi:MAG: iron-containing redox enzyme family protein [Betaproteobacteria bacterium]|jgi:pyrroloquinoline quinone (PQQ) biosynthesis protein C|nr:MAG: iron-containing redox enzyme family protein [Betaproteobacteria bacterium]HXL76027.1 iron-containing redox enzyme family protein [Burkholderiales bacterium]
MSFFITLVEMTDASRRDLELIPKVHSMMNHGLTLAEYRGFLHDLYHIVWHFCPVMSAAAARCDDRFRDVRYDLYERIEEEKGHDSWVLEDIEALGGDVRAVRETPPSPPAQAMIAFNYYASDRVHPCSVLGMLYMLEVVSSVYGGRVSDSIARALGRNVEDGGFKFLSSHATMDLDHMAKLNRLVKTIDDAGAQNAIVNATRVNFHQFGQLFREGGGLLAT